MVYYAASTLFPARETYMDEAILGDFQRGDTGRNTEANGQELSEGQTFGGGGANIACRMTRI